jgi:type VI secretion system protein ImpK
MRLIDCFVDVMAYVLTTADLLKKGAKPGYEDVRSQVERLLSEHQSAYVEGGYTETQYNHAKFAIIAFIDEIMLGTPWPETRRWSKDLLQKAHFAMATAGSEFFERYQKLNPFNPAEKDIREVYYYCLSLGFIGKYYNQNERGKLDEIRREAYQTLASDLGDARDLANAELFPGANLALQDAGKGINQRHRLDYLYYGIPMLIIVTLYFWFRSEITEMANALTALV